MRLEDASFAVDAIQTGLFLDRARFSNSRIATEAPAANMPFPSIMNGDCQVDNE
jgi:hypothetical protein